MRVNGDGEVLWADDGVPAPTEQTLPVVVTDGSGGVDVPVLAGSGGALRFALASANPTRGASRFSLELPTAAFVRVEVIDVLGRRVRTIAGELRAAGAHSLSWDGASESSGRVAPGIYFVRLRAGAESRSERVVVVR